MNCLIHCICINYLTSDSMITVTVKFKSYQPEASMIYELFEGVSSVSRKTTRSMIMIDSSNAKSLIMGIL